MHKSELDNDDPINITLKESTTMISNSFNDQEPEHPLVYPIDEETLDRLLEHFTEQEIKTLVFTNSGIDPLMGEDNIFGIVSDNDALAEYLKGSAEKDKATMNQLILKSISDYQDLAKAFHTVLAHPELLDYIEGNCSEQGKVEITNHTTKYPRIKEHVQYFIDFEKEHGVGSYRKSMEASLDNMDSIRQSALKTIEDNSKIMP